MAHRSLICWALLALYAVAFTSKAIAQNIDRLTVGYDLMFINRVHFKDNSSADVPGIYRSFFHAEAKSGPLRVGLIYQVARGEGFNAQADEGLMITGSYEHLLSYSMKIKALGRVGITRGVDFGNILYPTDTDITFQVGYFNPDGQGFFMDYPLFPSAYVGVIVNQFGRVQIISGAGTFWRGLNLYLTGFYALNGVSNIQNPPNDQADIAFGFLNNSGVNASIGIHIRDWILGVRHNFPVFNSGNDWVFSVQHTFFFD